MFKTCCGDCGECWYVGNPRTCTCPDETTKRTRKMNANELADRLDKISYDCTIEEWRASPVGEAATKLRQQQESIEGLNRDYDLLFAEHQLLLKKVTRLRKAQE